VIEAPKTDFVSKINQHFQKTQRLSSAPITYEKRHSPKKGIFRIAVVYEGKEVGVGDGKTPKEAKQNAAKEACRTLNIK
jgi:ribonuclease-3